MWDTGGDSNGPDAELVADPAARETLIGVVREGARQGSVGYVADWIAQSEPWGFTVADVSQVVHVWWGKRDAIVNRAEAEYLARTMCRTMTGRSFCRTEGRSRHWPGAAPRTTVC